MFYAFAALFFVAVGVLGEHYLGRKPKLDQEELFRVFELIDEECMENEPLGGIAVLNYERVRELREELFDYMETGNRCTVSTELFSILERVEDLSYNGRL